MGDMESGGLAFILRGDLNADGYDDILMDNTIVNLFNGPVTGEHYVSDADVTISVFDGIGEAPVASGDLNEGCS